MLRILSQSSGQQAIADFRLSIGLKKAEANWQLAIDNWQSIAPQIFDARMLETHDGNEKRTRGTPVGPR